MSADAFPPVCPHGDLERLFDDIWLVQGSVTMSPPPMRFSRNMTVLRHDGALTLVNSMRLDEARLEALEALGEVRHVIRLAGFHGMDDPFYQDRYGASVWCVKGMPYAKGFDATKTAPEAGYFQPDHVIEDGATLPVPGARLHVIPGRVPEAVLWLDRDDGILVTGDSLQNWDRTDKGFNWPARIVMRLMGFIKPFNVGPGWYKAAHPDRAALRAVLDLDFAHVLPAHGTPVIGGAREKFRPAVERATGG